MTAKQNKGIYAPDGSLYITLTDGSGNLVDASLGSVREFLTATRTYYVRTDGSDSNTGLTNTAGGAFLTIQKALNVVGLLDNGGFDITIQVADGTYTEALTIKSFVGGGGLIISGNITTPGNVIIAPASGQLLSHNAVGRTVTLRGFRLNSAAPAATLAVSSGALLNVGTVEFSANAAGTHLNATDGGRIVANANYTILGGAAAHLFASGSGAQVDIRNRTITISNTPAFSTSFVLVSRSSLVQASNVTFSGSATGSRWTASSAGGVFTNGAAAASYLPGNSAGSTTSPGWTDQV